MQGTLRDPLERLPPELWLQVLEDVGKCDTDQIFSLIFVSKRWRDSLTMIPSLWTRFKVREGQSSLVKARVLRELSRDAAVEIDIYFPMERDASKLAPYVPWERAKVIHIHPRALARTTPNLQHFFRNANLPVLEELHLPPSQVPYHCDRLPTFLLQSPLRRVSGFHIDELMVSKISKLEAFETCSESFGLLPSLLHTPYLQSLSLQEHGEENRLVGVENVNLFGASFPSISSITWKETGIIGLSTLLRWKGLHLRHLIVRLPLNELEELFEALCSTPSLHSLHISYRQTFGTDFRLPITLPTLNQLQSFYFGFGYNGSPLSQKGSRIFELLPGMLSSVTSLELSFSCQDNNVLLHCFENLPQLRRLIIFLSRNTATEPNSARLVSLLKLECLKVNGSPEILQHLSTPNLLNLSVKAPSDICLQSPLSHLKRLEIGSAIPPDELEPWSQDLDLPSLTCISFQRYTKNSELITIFCELLIRRPSQFPSLEEIESTMMPSWDMLFIMLLRRNFSSEPISKIKSLTLPMYPGVRVVEILTQLLSGVLPPTLSIPDVFDEDTIEMLLDPLLYVLIYFPAWISVYLYRPGCVECIRNHKPCYKSLNRSLARSYGWAVHNLYDIPWEEPLPHSSIRRWVEERADRENGNEQRMSIFQMLYRRMQRCTLPPKAPIRITGGTLSGSYR